MISALVTRKVSMAAKETVTWKALAMLCSEMPSQQPMSIQEQVQLQLQADVMSDTKWHLSN